MTLIPLTKEQIISGIVTPFMKALSYGLSLIKEKEIVAEIVAEVKLAAEQLNVETPPTTEEAVRSVLAIGETLADTTPTQADDLAVDAAQVGADFVFKRGAGFLSLLSLIKLRKKAKAI